MSDNRCTATSSQSGQQCRRAPVLGAAVCATHGGSAPQVRAAGAERAAEQKAQERALRVVREWAPTDLELSPVDVLVRTMSATYTQGALHRAQLAREADNGTDPYVRIDKSGRHYPSPLALLEQAERRLSADISAKAISSGLAERVVRLQERQAEAVVAAMESFARLCNMDPAEPAVRAAIRTALLQIEGAA